MTCARTASIRAPIRTRLSKSRTVSSTSRPSSPKGLPSSMAFSISLTTKVISHILDSTSTNQEKAPENAILSQKDIEKSIFILYRIIS